MSTGFVIPRAKTSLKDFFKKPKTKAITFDSITISTNPKEDMIPKASNDDDFKEDIEEDINVKEDVVPENAQEIKDLISSQEDKSLTEYMKKFFNELDEDGIKKLFKDFE